LIFFIIKAFSSKKLCSLPFFPKKRGKLFEDDSQPKLPLYKKMNNEMVLISIFLTSERMKFSLKSFCYFERIRQTKKTKIFLNKTFVSFKNSRNNYFVSFVSAPEKETRQTIPEQKRSLERFQK